MTPCVLAIITWAQTKGGLWESSHHIMGGSRGLTQDAAHAIVWHADSYACANAANEKIYNRLS